MLRLLLPLAIPAVATATAIASVALPTATLVSPSAASATVPTITAPLAIAASHDWWACGRQTGYFTTLSHALGVQCDASRFGNHDVNELV